MPAKASGSAAAAFPPGAGRAPRPRGEGRWDAIDASTLAAPHPPGGAGSGRGAAERQKTFSSRSMLRKPSGLYVCCLFEALVRHDGGSPKRDWPKRGLANRPKSAIIARGTQWVSKDIAALPLYLVHLYLICSPERGTQPANPARLKTNKFAKGFARRNEV